jgi:hypothetical protein
MKTSKPSCYCDSTGNRVCSHLPFSRQRVSSSQICPSESRPKRGKGTRVCSHLPFSRQRVSSSQICPSESKPKRGKGTRVCSHLPFSRQCVSSQICPSESKPNRDRAIITFLFLSVKTSNLDHSLSHPSTQRSSRINTILSLIHHTTHSFVCLNILTRPTSFQPTYEHRSQA